MKDLDKIKIIRSAEDMMICFGCLIAFVLLFFELISDGCYDISLFLIMVGLVGDALLVYLTHERLKMLLDLME